MEISKYDSAFRKIICMNKIFLYFETCSYFISSSIKRNNYERPKFHPNIYFVEMSRKYL